MKTGRDTSGDRCDSIL